MTTKPVSGIIVPTPTLFDDRGRLDEEANARHVDWLITQGVHGIFALGTTGEFTSLSSDERRTMATLTVRAARYRLIMCSPFHRSFNHTRTNCYVA